MATEKDFKIKNGLILNNDTSGAKLTREGNFFRNTTQYGYIQLGPNNSGFAHIDTDRNTFYFNRKIQVDTGEISSYNEDLFLQRAGSTKLTLGTTSATFADDVIVSGNLTVQGTTVTLDTATLNVEDKNITLNYSTGDSSASADGAGITIQDAVNSTTDATILWDATNDEFDFSHSANVTGNITVSGSISSGTITAGTTSSAATVRAHDGAGNYATMQGYGIEFTRSSSYLRPTADGTMSLYVGAADATLDWNTIYFRSNNGLVLNGTQFISAGGNLTNIGTISSGAIIATGTGNEVISINSSANGAQINFNSATSSTDWIVGIANDTTEDYIIYQSGTGTGDIRLYTDGLERLTVLHGGNVGIGQNNPSYPLHVVGKIYSTSEVQGGTALIKSDATYGATLGSNSSGTGIAIARDGNPATYPDIIIDSSGEVGIGVTTPTNKLHVSRNSNSTVANLAEVDNVSAVRIGPHRADTDSNLYIGAMINSTTTGIQSRDSSASGVAHHLALQPYGGNFFVGNTVVNPSSGSSTISGMGYEYSTGQLEVASTSGTALEVARNQTNNGDVISIRKSGTIVGSIGTEGGDSLYVQGSGSSGAGLLFHGTAGKILPVRSTASIDATIDLGQDTRRFKDLWLYGTAKINNVVRSNSRVSTTQASQIYPVGHYSQGDMVFAIDPTWAESELRAYFNSSNVSWSSDSTAPGGYSIYINGNVNVGGVYGSGFPYIPVETGDIFYMECWVKNAGSNQSHYLGSNEFNESFSSLGGNPGSYGYWVMSGTDAGTGGWTKYAGYISNISPGTTVGEFEAGTKYWTPMALWNYGAGTGTRACYISGWKVYRINRGAQWIIQSSSQAISSSRLGNSAANNYSGSIGSTWYPLSLVDNNTQPGHPLVIKNSRDDYWSVGLDTHSYGIYVRAHTANTRSILQGVNTAGGVVFDAGFGGDLTISGSFVNNGVITSNNAFAFITTGGAAQDIRTKSVFAGTSYGDTPPAGSVNATNTYEINGTTVIDSSRNLTNIGNISTGGSPNITASNGSVIIGGGQSNSVEFLTSTGSGQPRIRPSNSGTVDIGDATRKFKDLHLSGTIDSGNIYADYSLLGRGFRSANRGELHLNATGATDVSEIFFGYGDGYTDANIRWGISDRGSADDRLLIYRGPYHGGFGEVAAFDASDRSFRVWGGIINDSSYSQTGGTFSTAGASTVTLTDGYERVKIHGYDLLGYPSGSNGLWLISNVTANASNVVDFVLGTEWDWDDSMTFRYTPAASGSAGGVLTLGQLQKNSTNWNHTTTYFYMNGANRFKFENDGDFIATGNVTAYGSMSDIRLKENIRTIENSVEKVQKLRGITFDYKEDGKRSTGLIAQELEEVLPEAVYETEGMDQEAETYKAIRYGNVVGLLVEAIKEQQTTIESLKNEIKDLVKDINSLKGGN